MMILTEALSARDKGQLERKELARGAWREGNLDNADLLIDSVLAEEMSPRVAAECYSTKAGISLARKDAEGAMRALDAMAPHLEVADIRIQGTFFLQRGRAHRQLGNIDSALTDYTGALTYWQICGDKNYEGAAYINLAECYLRQNDIEQAYFNIARAFAVLPGSSEYLCNAYDTKAKILLADGKAERAYTLIEKALASTGGNERWEKDFLETREKIKTRLLELLVPISNMDDVDDLRVKVIRYALDQHNGSVKSAAKTLGISRQSMTYIADSHGIKRAKRKKSIIKPLR